MAEYLSDGSRRHIAGVRPGAVLVVAGDDAATTVGELWPTMSADRHDRGDRAADRAGLRQHPRLRARHLDRDHAAAGPVRVLVRGDFEVAIGATRISGVGVSTWTERRGRCADRVRDRGARRRGGDDWFPMVDGIVDRGARGGARAMRTSSLAAVLAVGSCCCPRRSRGPPRRRPRRTPCRRRCITAAAATPGRGDGRGRARHPSRPSLPVETRP